MEHSADVRGIALAQCFIRLHQVEQLIGSRHLTTLRSDRSGRMACTKGANRSTSAPVWRAMASYELRIVPPVMSIDLCLRTAAR